jgi:hypothetical protein
MTITPRQQLSPEVTKLERLIDSARLASPGLWDSVASALNAAEASILIAVGEHASPMLRVMSATETISAASRLEVRYE